MIAVVDYGAGQRLLRHARAGAHRRTLDPDPRGGRDRPRGRRDPAGRGRLWRRDGPAGRERHGRGPGAATSRPAARCWASASGSQSSSTAARSRPAAPALPGCAAPVRRIPAAPERKVPHMGWNQIEICRQDPLFAGLPENPYFYFVHSYYVDAADKSCVLARVDYGVPMDVAVRRDNLCAVQFHPERAAHAACSSSRTSPRCARRIPCLPRESSPAWTSRPGAWSRA